jgi:hypothetical protein
MTLDNIALAHVDDGVRPHGAAGAPYGEILHQRKNGRAVHSPGDEAVPNARQGA